jgi:hypothetical protein
MSRSYPVQQCAECGTDIGAIEFGSTPLCPPCHAQAFSFVHVDDEREDDGEAA